MRRPICLLHYECTMRCYVREFSFDLHVAKEGSMWARSYMFSVHDPGQMFSKQVLGTQAFRLRALWNVLGTPSFRFKIGTHFGLRSMTYCIYMYTAQHVRSFYRALSMLIAVCVLSPAQLEHVLGFTSFRLHFGGVLRGRFVPRTRFDRVPAGTVLAGTQLFRTRSDCKKWCVPRTMWTPGVMLQSTFPPNLFALNCLPCAVEQIGPHVHRISLMFHLIV